MGAGLAASGARPIRNRQPATFTSPCTSSGCIVEALRPKQPAAASHQVARPPWLALPVLGAGARFALESGGLPRHLRKACSARCKRSATRLKLVRSASGFKVNAPKEWARAGEVQTASGLRAESPEDAKPDRVL